MAMSTKIKAIEEKYLEERIKVPSDVKVSLDNLKLTVSGKLGTNHFDFSHAGVEMRLEGDEIVVRVVGRNRKAKAILGTVKSIVKNLIVGVTKGFTYKMKIISSHFPMSVKVLGNEVIIENFIGERYPRRAKIIGNTKVTVKGDEVIVTGIDKYAVGQTAANIESATRVKGKDPRKFLDGIYVYQKMEGIER